MFDGEKDMSARPIMTASALQDLNSHIDAKVLICDCRFDLVDAELGAKQYAQGHIPGARYSNLNIEMSTHKTGFNGRHPLPTREAFAEQLAKIGLNRDTMLVAYDSSGGTYAARLWWMARWVGHTRVVVLDGGINAWLAAGYELTTEVPAALPKGNFVLGPERVRSVDMKNVREMLGNPDRLLVDARASDRFHGKNETLDKLAGHIPGARNRPYTLNLREDGTFKDAATLKAEFESVLQGYRPDQVVASCGSGVSACNNLIAMELAGLSGAALYGGSWSEWSTQENPPLEI
jgi:thiosulfate/3-mercaptopyruvate sulfurtransferase